MPKEKVLSDCEELSQEALGTVGVGGCGVGGMLREDLLGKWSPSPGTEESGRGRGDGDGSNLTCVEAWASLGWEDQRGCSWGFKITGSGVRRPQVLVLALPEPLKASVSPSVKALTEASYGFL